MIIITRGGKKGMDDRRHKNLVADALLPLINLLLYTEPGK